MTYNDIANLIVYQGDDLDLVVDVQDQDGNTVDVSNVNNIEWVVSKTVDGAADATKTLGSGIVINNPEQFTITLDAATTAQLDGVYYSALSGVSSSRPTSQAINASYYHECRITNSAGKSNIVFSGRLFVRTSLLESQ